MESLANRITGPVIATVGLFGNTLAFLVYSKMSRANSNGAYCFFLQSLCITDSLTLLATSFYIIVYGYQVQIVDIPVICKLVNFVVFFSGACSSWVEVVSALDRAIFTICPNRFRSIQTSKKLCLLLVICSIAYNLAIYSPLLYYFRVEYDNDSVAYCMVDDTPLLVFTWLDLFSAGLLPFLIMLACSLAIFKRLSRSRVNLEESNTSNVMVKRKKKDVQFALTSCSLNVFFFITYAGFGIFIGIQASGIPLFNQYPAIYLMFLYVYLLNFSCKFFIYLLVNRSFRNQFVSMVKMFINGLAKIIS